MTAGWSGWGSRFSLVWRTRQRLVRQTPRTVLLPLVIPFVLIAASCLVTTPTADASSSQPRPSVSTCAPGFSVLDTITSENAGGGAFAVADINTDGRQDLVSGSHTSTEQSSLSWWENIGGGKFVRRAIDTGLVAAHSAVAVDLDQDGYMDLLATTFFNQLLWYRNNGAQNFTRILIDSTYPWVRSVCAADLDGDHDIDIAASGRPDDPFSWWENDGNQNFTRHSLPYLPFHGDVWMITPVDLNSDGAMDLIAAADSSREIPWWQNDGKGNFTLRTIQGIAYGVTWVATADINGDGHMDVVGASEGEGSLIWWENDGNQNFSKHTLSPGWFIATSVGVRDLDGDGDIDLVMSELYSCAWWENDGAGNFVYHPLPGTFILTGPILAADLNGDCSPDVVMSETYGHQIVRWENECILSTCDCFQQGDVKSDGVYDVLDVLALTNYVFTNGSRPPIDSLCPSLDRGDVNCDGVDDVMDVIYMIDFVFANGKRPCSACVCP